MFNVQKMLASLSALARDPILKGSKMPLSKITAIAAAVLVAGFAAYSYAQTVPEIVVDPAIAGMTNEQLIEARQNAMMEDGKILRGAGGLLGDDAVEAATHILQNFTNFPALFKEGSSGGESKALPAVWENWDAFLALLTKGQGFAKTMLEAAVNEDDDAYQAAIKSLGGLCGECHQQFRGR